MSGAVPSDEDVAALLAVLALTRGNGDVGGTYSVVTPLRRWRAQRMAALARTSPPSPSR
jgi:hypothetical protein